MDKGMRINELNREIYTEKEMLKGNINRILITKDVNELEKMKNVAIMRIESIYVRRQELFNIYKNE